MKWHLGIFLTAAAGCTTPVRRTPVPVAPEITTPAPPTGICVPRLGIEFLPAELADLHHTRGLDGATVTSPALGRRHIDLASTPTTYLEVSAPIATASPGGIGSEPEEAPPDREAWNIDEAEIHNLDAPLQELTLQFVNNVISEDSRRAHRRVGAPILHNAWRRVDHQGFESQLDQRDREDQVQAISAETRSLVSRALHKALRKSSYARDLAILVDDFKASAVPFTGAYEEQHQHEGWGRVSLRWRLDNRDPLEATYINNGWRIGSGMQRLKLGYGKQLSPEVWVGLRTHYYYEVHRLSVFGDVQWEFSPESTCHVLVGDQVDVQSSMGVYSVISSPYTRSGANDSNGALFYVEHFF